MGINTQMKKGINRLIGFDSDTATVTRKVMAVGNRGQLAPAGETAVHTVLCRISTEGGGVWHRGEWVGGLVTDTTPYVLADVEADINADDTLEWRGKRYTVGAVTYPPAGGAAVCLQAPLTEVK